MSELEKLDQMYKLAIMGKSTLEAEMGEETSNSFKKIGACLHFMVNKTHAEV